ncbi:hypothetical protein ES703_65217 [subsurface metagenome]
MLGPEKLPEVPPPPQKAPWQDLAAISQKLSTVVSLLQAGVGVAGVPIQIRMERGEIRPSAATLLLQQVGLSPEQIDLLANNLIIPFQKTVAVEYQDEQDRSIGYSGIITDVIMAFPAGCQHLVDVRLLYIPKGGGRRQVIPSLPDTFIALDNFTQVFRPSFPVKAPGIFRVEWWNYDFLNAHSVPVIIILAPLMRGS